MVCLGPVDPRFKSSDSQSIATDAPTSPAGIEPMTQMGAGAQLQPTPSPMSSPGSNNLDKLDSIRYVNMTMRNQPILASSMPC